MTERGDIWLVDTESGAWPDEAAARAWLAPSECVRADRYASDSLRRRYVASVWALRTLLAAAGSRSIRGAEFDRGANGKPHLPAGPQFTLSRSAHLALIAIAPASQIGIDIECVRPVEPPSGWRRRFRALAAAAGAPAGTHDDLEFLRAWTRLEARVKCAGAALANVLDDDADSAFALQRLLDAPYIVTDLQPTAGCVAAVAATHEVDFRLRAVDASALAGKL